MNSGIAYGVGMKTTITFGRMNPPTRGHEKLINKVKELAGDDDHHVFTSQTHDPKRNPLSPDQKGSYMKSSFPDVNIHSQPSPFHALTHLQDKGYKDVTVVVGADRVNEFERIGSHKDFKFDNYNVVSAGEREGGEIENISASGARTAAKEKRYGDFSSMTPTLMSNKQSKQMYADLQNQMEEFDLANDLFSDQEELTLFYEAFLPMKYLFEQDTYTAQSMAMDTMQGGADYGQDTQDRDRKRIDRQESRKKSESNPWPELLVIRNAQDNKIRLIPKADFDPNIQEILSGNMPGSPPMGEVTPQIAFSVMQEPEFEASKTSNKLLKMFGVSNPNELSLGSQESPGSGAPAPVGGSMVSPEEQMAMDMPRTPPDGRERIDSLSTYPDWDHQPMELVDSGVMMWNIATGRNPLDGGVSPELEQTVSMSATLNDSANRFAGELLQEIPADYIAYTNAGIPAQLSQEWVNAGGSDPTPKSKMIFTNPATNDYIRANVAVGKTQLMDQAKGESTTLFNTLSRTGVVTPFTQRKEVKALTNSVKSKLSTILSTLNDKSKTIKEDVGDIISEATRIYDEISGKIEDMVAVDKNLKKEIIRETITGQLKFGPDSIGAASHLITSNRDGTNTQIHMITEGLLSKINDLAKVNVYFSPADIEDRIQTEQTDGTTFIDYVRSLVQGSEEKLQLDNMSPGSDFQASSEFDIDSASYQSDVFLDYENPAAPPEFQQKSMEDQQQQTISQQAASNFNNIFDVMKFFSIGVEAIDIDPVNLTALNDKKAEKYNIITVNGKRFRVPVDRDIQDIMDDYNYIDKVFNETLMEGYKNRKARSRKPDGGCEECARQKKEGKARSEYCYQNCGKKGEKLRDSRGDHVKVNRDNGTEGNGDGDDWSKAKDGTYKKEKPKTNRSRNGQDGRSTMREEHGAGDIGTMELLKKYLKDTPFSSIMGYKPNKSNKCPYKDKKKETNDSKKAT